MSSSPFPDRELSPREVLECVNSLTPNAEPNDNTTERGRRIVREFAAALGAGGDAIVRARRVLREAGVVAADESPDAADGRQVGAVLGCIERGDIDPERELLAALDVDRWHEDSNKCIWRVRVPDDWPEVRDA